MTDGERLKDIVEAAVARGDAPGVVAAVATGDETHMAAAGVMAVAGPAMRADTLFRIASITKPVTATVVLSLVEDGLLGLDEPVDRLLPELANRRVLRRPDGPLTDTVAAERAVTTRDLLTFTWGFGMQGAMFMAPELVSTAADLVAFGRMLLRGGDPVLKPGTVAEMTRNQLTPAQRARVWPGFSFLGDRGWGYGVSVTEWGYTWEGGSGTAWSNTPDQDLTVVVLTQRAPDETGMPAVCEQVRMAMSS